METEPAAARLATGAGRRLRTAGTVGTGTGLGSGMYASEPSSTLNTRMVMSRKSRC